MQELLASLPALQILDNELTEVLEDFMGAHARMRQGHHIPVAVQRLARISWLLRHQSATVSQSGHSPA